MGLAIKVNGLSKNYRAPVKREGIWGGIQDLLRPRYADVHAVQDISFEISEGEFVGYIGPNGAGKSTSIKMLTGILQPSAGELSILGLSPFFDRKEYVSKIGVVFGQRTQLWWDIAVIESFELLRRIYEVPRDQYKDTLDRLVAIFEVGSLLKTPVRKLSLGERMKCDIIASLLHSPSILFLDEPTIGLDAIAKNAIREVLRQLHKEAKTTILLTTHDLQEIEELCNRILVLDKGHLMFDGSVEGLFELNGLSRILEVVLISTPDDLLVEGLQTMPGVQQLEVKDTSIRITFDPTKTSVVTVLEKASSGRKVKDLMLHDAGIEEVITQMYLRGETYGKYGNDARS